MKAETETFRNEAMVIFAHTTKLPTFMHLATCSRGLFRDLMLHDWNRRLNCCLSKCAPEIAELLRIQRLPPRSLLAELFNDDRYFECAEYVFPSVEPYLPERGDPEDILELFFLCGILLGQTLSPLSSQADQRVRGAVLPEFIRFPPFAHAFLALQHREPVLSDLETIDSRSLAVCCFFIPI